MGTRRRPFHRLWSEVEPIFLPDLYEIFLPVVISLRAKKLIDLAKIRVVLSDVR